MSLSSDAQNSDAQNAAWRKSTRSGSNGCVEVLLGSVTVGVRDSKLERSPEFHVEAGAWRSFVEHVVADSFTR